MKTQKIIKKLSKAITFNGMTFDFEESTPRAIAIGKHAKTLIINGKVIHGIDEMDCIEFAWERGYVRGLSVLNHMEWFTVI